MELPVPEVPGHTGFAYILPGQTYIRGIELKLAGIGGEEDGSIVGKEFGAAAEKSGPVPCDVEIVLSQAKFPENATCASRKTPREIPGFHHRVFSHGWTIVAAVASFLLPPSRHTTPRSFVHGGWRSLFKRLSKLFLSPGCRA